ncbi:MAG: PilT/PilU family type 4a pilus ATPase [Verrucomicrobiota bacterium]|jgi:twitching motility protein PilT
MERIAPSSSLGKLLDWCRQQAATDLHAQADRRYAFRMDGKLQRIPPEQFAVPTNDDIVKMLREAFSSSICDRIEKQHEMDLSFLCDRLRYRANFSKQQGAQSFSFRVVPQRIPKLDDLQLPATVADLVNEPRGLLLVTGAAGQGKSTTACALLQRLNEALALRIITIEDPIEYLFIEDQCQFEQREVGVDTASFAEAIRNAVRQDPEVIFIGEIRDRDTVQTAMLAAETGHLVLATLHADSVPQTLDRIRELHPASEQANASTLLARSVNAIICQRLVPSTLDKRIPCLEIMRRTTATQEAIARNDLHLLSGIIEASVNEGMQSFDQHLMQLFKQGSVTLETARYYASNWNRLEMEMHGYTSSVPGILKPDRER